MPKYNESRQTALIGIQDYLDPDSTGWAWRHVGNTGRIEYTSQRLEDDFLGDQLQGEWQQTGDGAGVFAIANAINGTVVGTTAVTDDFRVDLAHNLNWAANRATIFEARVTVDDIATMCVMVGLTDAVTEGASALPYANAAGRNLVADDCVMIGFDTDGAIANWCGLSGNATVAGTIRDLGVAPVAGTFEVLRIELDTAGNADFYIDGTYIASEALAVTITDPLTPFVGVMNRVGAVTRAVTVDYVNVYQRRTV